MAKPAGGSTHQDLDEGFKTYDCGTLGVSGLIVGGTRAKPGEFPHMAGWLNDVISIKIRLMKISQQQLDIKRWREVKSNLKHPVPS